MNVSLNPQQIEAVQHVGSPLMIVAGAGSGKTTVITEKILYYIRDMGVYPDHILAITFTNKAAKEMKDRILSRISTQKTPVVSTFHAFCANMLRHHFKRLNRGESFAICDQSDQLKIIKSLLKEQNLSETYFSPNSVLFSIQDVKNRLILPDKIDQDAVGKHWDSRIKALYIHYQKYLNTYYLLDFNDLILYAVLLLETYPDILKDFQDKLPFILVDEYQDTNMAQYRLIKLLAEAHQQLTVVGDFDQTIYSWRGASNAHMLGFQKDYPHAKTIFLEQNYRSTKPILDAANAVISHNTQRQPKTLWTQHEGGELIQIQSFYDEKLEASAIAKWLKKNHSLSISFSQMAILLRTNAQSRALEEALILLQIPYKMIQGVAFFSRSEIKDIVAYLRLILNENDGLAFERVVNIPSRSIGSTSLEKIKAAFQKGAYPIRNCLSLNTLTNRAKASLANFFDILDRIHSKYETLSHDRIGTLIHFILEETGYKQFLLDSRDTDRLDNILELISLAREEEWSLEGFLNHISLRSEWDDQATSVEDAVTVMTIHSAKGLEFEAVVLAGIEEGILPHYKSKLSPDEIEEERRLCYVAMTRAKQKLFLTHCSRRLIFGEIWTNDVSRFVSEIPAHLLQKNEHVVQKLPDTYSHFEVAQSQIKGYTPGSKIMHTQWGEGTIISVEGSGDQTLLLIRFGYQEKKLMAKYAPIQLIA